LRESHGGLFNVKEAERSFKYTDYFIGVDIEGFYQFYGKDAESIAEQLGRETIQNVGESIALKTPLS